MATVTMKIWVILVDNNNHPISPPFKVLSLGTDDIDDLKEKVKEKANLSIPAFRLKVWRCSNPEVKFVGEDVAAQIQDVFSKNEVQYLDEQQEIAELQIKVKEILLVQVQEQPNKKRKLENEEDLDIQMQERRDENRRNMQKLFDIAWNQQSRGQLYTTVQDTQEQVLQCLFSFSEGQPERVFIRQEYYQALQDAISFFHGETRFITTYTEEDKEWGMLIDANVTGADNRPEGSKQGPSKDDDVSRMVVDSDKNEDKVPKINWSRDRQISPAHRVFIVTGSPGIGKTLWLYYVLVERLLQKLPTYFQNQPDHVTYWSENGVEEMALTNPQLDNIPKDVWYLADSNDEVNKPSQKARLSSGRIVMAASRRTKRFNWVWKLGLPHYEWVMKPESYKELVLMREYQGPTARDITDNELRSFCESFGTCARHVYWKAKDPDDYRGELERRLGAMTLKSLRTLVQNAQWAQSDAEDLSHWIVGIYPGPTRKDAYVTIQTAEILKLIQRRFASEWDQHVWKLFDTFRGHSHTRSPAGRILEERLHDTLVNGGKWLGTEMVAESMGSQNTTFTDKFPNCRQLWLSVGPGAVITASEPPEFERTALDLHRFKFGQYPEQLTTGYYRPSSSTHAGYDSFILNIEAGEKSLIVIQSTISMRHDFKKRSLEYLERDWVAQKSDDDRYVIHYVIITDDQTPITHVPIANQYKDLIKTKLHICMPTKDLFPHAPTGARPA